MATNTPEWIASHKAELQKYRREWYARNRKHAIGKINERIEENKRWYRELKSTLECELCKNTHPSVLTFHHIEPSEKDKDVCRGVCDGWSKERVLKEIKKCKVLCFNCHAILHWNEKQ